MMKNDAQPIMGYKVPRNTTADMTIHTVIKETDDQIETRLLDRFNVLAHLTKACIAGQSRSLIVSGPPGLGKSFTIEQELMRWDTSSEKYAIVKGYVRATGLYKLLYKYKDEGKVIVFDDADAIFYDDVSLNLLKTVCDTTENRKVSWLAETKMMDDNDDRLPRNFDFEGTIIFITNLDFDDLIKKGHKLTPHLEALVSRSHYIDLGMKNKRDYLLRIRQVIKQGMLGHMTDDQKNDIMSFMNDNQNILRELSLRMAIKLASIRCSTHLEWEKVAKITCCKNS
jgi:hypothetical protein